MIVSVSSVAVHVGTPLQAERDISVSDSLLERRVHCSDGHRLLAADQRREKFA